MHPDPATFFRVDASITVTAVHRPVFRRCLRCSFLPRSGAAARQYGSRGVSHFQAPAGDGSRDPFASRPRLATGDWRLATGDSRLATGDSRLLKTPLIAGFICAICADLRHLRITSSAVLAADPG